MFLTLLIEVCLAPNTRMNNFVWVFTVMGEWKIKRYTETSVYGICV